MRPQHFVSLLLAASALAGCSMTPSTWTRDKTTAEVAANDLTSCRQSARQEVFQYGGYGGFGTFWGGRRFGWGVGGGWGWNYPFGSDRGVEEDRLADFCMRSKGYALTTPATPG